MNRESGIFISYRRQDSSGHAGRLRDNLRAAFGAQVFHDVDGIADGEVFEQVLEKALTACDVAVVIIGRTWLTCTDEQGHRRLDDPEDWVRIETRMLLSRNIRVIPVLVGGATIPRTADLPEDLRALAKRQSRELRDTAWDADVTALIERLREIVQPRHQHRTVSGAALTPHRGKIVAGIAALVLVGVIAWSLYSRSTNGSDADRASAPVVETSPAETSEQPKTTTSKQPDSPTTQPASGNDAKPVTGPADRRQVAGGESHAASNQTGRAAHSDALRGTPPQDGTSQVGNRPAGLPAMIDQQASSAGSSTASQEPQVAIDKASLISQLKGLQLRKDVIVPGLDALRRRQRDRGFELRADMASAEQRMMSSLSAAEGEIGGANIDLETVLLSLRHAESAIKTLEDFLGIG